MPDFLNVSSNGRILARIAVDEPPRVGEVVWLAPGSGWRVVAVAPNGVFVRPENGRQGLQRFDERR